MMFYYGKPSRDSSIRPLRHVPSRVIKRASLPESELLYEESVISSLCSALTHRFCHFGSTGSPQQSSRLIHARNVKSANVHSAAHQNITHLQHSFTLLCGM